jgi:alkylation response protein AidB-like acyl-CoA dehydrogenase
VNAALPTSLLLLTVADWVDHEVRPVVRELEHADTYPGELIEQMKRLGIYGLAIPAPWGEAPVPGAGVAGAGPVVCRMTSEVASSM